MPDVEAFVARALAQAGEVYVYGAEVPLDAPLAGVQQWDCSELVQVVAHQAGGFMPDGSRAQLAYCQRQRAVCSIDEGIATRGALLFVQAGTSRHVAISLGTGNTIEARGRAYGVGVFGARARAWTHAARLPGFTYPRRPQQEAIALTVELTPDELDQFRDMLRVFGPLVAALIFGRTDPDSSMWQRIIGIETRLDHLQAELELRPQQ